MKSSVFDISAISEKLPKIARVIVAFLVIGSLLSGGVLTGCSKHNTHQIIGPVPNCVGCHGEEPLTFDNVLTPASAVDVGSVVEVKTKYNAVYVCTPIFTSEDGSTYVPLIYDRVRAEDGIATINLTPGAWVLAVDKGETSEAILVESVPEIDKVKKLRL